ncbi:hypothetical protein Tco_0044211, partial [Tanacetum coccineum]
KGKAKIVEEPMKLKKKDQERIDKEVAAKLQAEFDKEARIAREEAERLEQANIALINSWDNVQAMIKADQLLAERLQSREQEELTKEEKARLFMQLLKKKRKHFAAKRAKEKRNRPPTQDQQRNLYTTYLNNMEWYTLKQLKGFKFEVIKDMFNKAFKRVNTFIDYKTELVEEHSKKAEAEIAQESNEKVEAEVDDDQEEAKMKKHMEIVLDEEVVINAIPLATKPLSFSAMLRSFDKEDLETLWKFVRARFKSTQPVEDLDLILCWDLKTMFEPETTEYAHLHAG